MEEKSSLMQKSNLSPISPRPLLRVFFSSISVFVISTSKYKILLLRYLVRGVFAAHKSGPFASKSYYIPLLELPSPKDFMGESTTCAMLQAVVIYSLLVLINLSQLLLLQSSYPTEVAQKTPVCKNDIKHILKSEINKDRIITRPIILYKFLYIFALLTCYCNIV